MSQKQKKFKITGAHEKHADESHVLVEKGVKIVVTELFGPTGDNLVGISDASFDGYAAITIRVETGDQSGLVHLSPIHGDPRKQGMTDIPTGAKCKLICPASGQPLDHVGAAEDGTGAEYYALYLTTKLSEGEMVCVSDIWGHYHSRVVDNFELISSWADMEDDLLPH
jgi:hypothetical protein